VFLCVLLLCVGMSVAPPPKGKEEAELKDQMYNTDGLTPQQAQEQEYFRYISQIVGELEKDENFKTMSQNVTEEDIKSGKLADLLDHVGHDVRKRIDEVKRMEVEYQRDLIRKNKHNHMADVSQTFWNPVHHDNQDTFEKDDLKVLLMRHSQVIEDMEAKRHEQFKKHEMEKEHERREALKNMTEIDRQNAEKKHKEEASTHEKIHEPGHKAQLEEVWDSDGYDPENFEPRTFFHIHDKDGNGYLDYYETETLFLHDLDKLYNMSDPNVDLWERSEELERMRMHMLKVMDTDHDGLVSYEEFMKESTSEDFNHDEEWKSVGEDEQVFTDAEYDEYERLLAEVRKEQEEGTTEDEKKTKEGGGEKWF